MVQLQIRGDGGMTAAEKRRLRRRAFNRAQKKRAAGDYTPVEQLMDEDLEENGSKYLIELRKKQYKLKKKKKKNFDGLIEGATK